MFQSIGYGFDDEEEEELQDNASNDGDEYNNQNDLLVNASPSLLPTRFTSLFAPRAFGLQRTNSPNDFVSPSDHTPSYLSVLKDVNSFQPNRQQQKQQQQQQQENDEIITLADLSAISLNPTQQSTFHKKFLEEQQSQPQISTALPPVSHEQASLKDDASPSSHPVVGTSLPQAATIINSEFESAFKNQMKQMNIPINLSTLNTSSSTPTNGEKKKQQESAPITEELNKHNHNNNNNNTNSNNSTSDSLENSVSSVGSPTATPAEMAKTVAPSPTKDNATK